MDDTGYDTNPIEAGVVITNFAFNGDESTPHLHITFVPYSDHCSRGQQTQNALAQIFERMGYKTTMKQAVDEYDELVWQESPEGKTTDGKECLWCSGMD